MGPQTSSIIVISDDEGDPGINPSRTKMTRTSSSTAQSTKIALCPGKADIAAFDQAQKANPASSMSAVEEAHGFTSQGTSSTSATAVPRQADSDQHAVATVGAEIGQKSRSKSLDNPICSSGEAVETSTRSESEPCLKLAPKLEVTQPKTPALARGSICSTPSTTYLRAPTAYMGPPSRAVSAYASDPLPSPTVSKVSRGMARNASTIQATQVRAGESTTQSKSGTPQSTPTKVNSGKRKAMGDAISGPKRTKLANPPPTTPSNVGLWSIPAYEPGKEIVIPEKRSTPVYTFGLSTPQTAAAPTHPSTELGSTVADSNDSIKATPTASPNDKPAKKPRSTPWTCKQLSELGRTIQYSVPWAEFAERNGKTTKECLDLYSIVVGMPLMDFTDKALNRAKMAKFRERKQDYKNMEKEAKRVHKEEAREEAKREKELAKAERQKTKAGGAKEGMDGAGSKAQASFG